MDNPDTPEVGAVVEAPQSIGVRFRAWLDSAKPGEVFIYARTPVLDCQSPAEVQAVALAARESYARGVELVQARTNRKGRPFEYRAIKKREKRVPKSMGVPWLPKVPKPHGHRRSRTATEEAQEL